MVHARTRNGKKQNALVKASPLPEPWEIVKAVESLYADEIRPNSRILRKRLMEFHEPDGPWDVAVQKLLDICSRISEFEVVCEDQDDWWVQLAGRESDFVDIQSTTDTYPEELWHTWEAYFEANRELSLPGGRYECARALLIRNLPFLAGYSLGQVCHMVQVAISTKKILGYNLGSIVPYTSSQSMAKEQCAASNVACSGKGGQPAGVPALSWEDAKCYLQELLRSSPSTGIPLPNVKRLFKSRFDVQLSETALGYSKVSDLLQDPHFKDICVVRQQGQGYVVTEAPAQVICLSSLLQSAEPAAAPAASPAQAWQHDPTEAATPKRVHLCADEPLSLDDIDIENEPMVLVRTPSRTPGLPTWALSPATHSKNGYSQIEHNTFIHVKLPPTSPLFRSERRSRTEPCSMGERQDWKAEADNQCDDSTSEGSSNSSMLSSREESPDNARLHNSMELLEMQAGFRGQERVQFCPNEPLCLDDDSLQAVAPSPSPMLTPNRTAPGILRKNGNARSDRARRTVRFSIAEDPTDAAQANISTFQSTWTPGTCLKHRIRERNTFLDVAPLPPTPMGPAAVHQATSCGDIV